MGTKKKSKSKARVVKRMIGGLLIAAALVLLFSGYEMYREEQKEENEGQEQEELFDQIQDTGEENALTEAKKINSQVVAWIEIPDTPIDYPVLQSEDNEYYLNHNMEQEESQLGVPFLDYRCDSHFRDFHSIIYGHHITKERMFTPLVHFTEQQYFDSHTYGLLTTEEEQYKIHFFACMVVDHESFVYETVFLTDVEKEEFLNKVKTQAVRVRDFNMEELIDGQIVTLSTCSYEFQNARTVLVGYLESETE